MPASVGRAFRRDLGDDGAVVLRHAQHIRHFRRQTLHAYAKPADTRPTITVYLSGEGMSRRSDGMANPSPIEPLVEESRKFDC